MHFRRPCAILALPAALAALIFSFIICPLTIAEEVADDTSPADLNDLIEGTGRLPGVDLAEGISQITGTAVSPLLGVSAIGTWTYFSTPAEDRDALPWYCQPLIWGIGFSVLGLCFAKDSLGVALPPLLKKPLDLLELFENKASAAIASAAFVPLIAAQMSQRIEASSAATSEAARTMTSDSALLASAPMPMLSALPFGVMWLLIPLSIGGFLVVWLLGHAINVLLLLSPFGILDAFLKIIRLLAIVVIVAVSAIFPTLGIILCLAIIIVAALLAPAAFRLAVFGSIMGFDYLISLLWRQTKSTEKIHGFLARKTEHRLKARSFGSLECSPAGELSFVSRWLFFGPLRRLPIAEDSERASIDRGLLFPSLAVLEAFDDEKDGLGVEVGKSRKSITIIHLLPRYRHCVEDVAQTLRIAELRDNPIIRGFSAIKTWLLDTLRSGREKLPEARRKAAPPARL
jgi:ABC-type multidrug transport system fused ATPase/permease subunit